MSFELNLKWSLAHSFGRSARAGLLGDYHCSVMKCNHLVSKNDTPTQRFELCCARARGRQVTTRSALASFQFWPVNRSHGDITTNHLKYVVWTIPL